MRNPPNRDRYPSPDDSAPQPSPGGRRPRTIRDMFADAAPLRRLTSGPARRRRQGGASSRDRDNPPDHFDSGPMGQPASPSKRRWTEPGAYLESDRAPDQTDPRRSNRGGGPVRYPDHAREAPRAAAHARYAEPPEAAYDEPPSKPEAQAADTHLRWKRPEWLNHAPSPVQTPPTDPAPPTTPRYPLDGPETPMYEPDERDPQRQQTDYRATSVRAAYWASRAPSYQPDQPAAPIERDITEERAYFEAYSTRRTPASLAHADASLAGGQPQAYTPGVTSEVERLRREEKTRGRTAGPAPYFWEMMQKPQQTSPLLRSAFWLVSAALIVSALLTASYAGASVYAASKLVYTP
ncbi:MAG TPA: hypothetical protein VFN78_11415, partial [Ktedonobacterales bacterium]|nr:hypothetical protein [Ktedonobacterales bacterium]